MNIDDKNIDDYIARFLDGETTCQEEQQLYRYFASPNVPKRLQPYKPMFDWYADGMPCAAEEAVPLHRPIRRRGELIAFWSGVAAVLAIVIGCMLHIEASMSEDKEVYRMYEGSYIVQNGRRIDDLRIILPRLQQLEAKADLMSRSPHENNAALNSRAMQLLRAMEMEEQKSMNEQK